MDHFFTDEFQGDFFSWYEIGPLNQCAFVPYISSPSSQIWMQNSSNVSNPTNINKKMIEFLRRSCQVKIESQELESFNKCHRHMMSERLRREREKNGYLALHSMLPLGTKNDKNSIIQTAARRIQELKRCKEKLEERNHELEAKLAAMQIENVGSSKLRFKVGNPLCGVDSMLEVLKCVKSLGAKTTSIQSKFSDQQLLGVVGIETEVEAAEVEKAVQRALNHVEKRKLLINFPQS